MNIHRGVPALLADCISKTYCMPGVVPSLKDVLSHSLMSKTDMLKGAKDKRVKCYTEILLGYDEWMKNAKKAFLNYKISSHTSLRD